MIARRGWIYTILVTVACAGAQRPSLRTGPVADLSADDVCRARAAFVALHAEGMEAIPRLIEAVGDEQPSSRMLRNPMQALAQESDFSTPSGLVAAYAIELLLSRSTLETRPDPSCEFVLEQEDYVFDYGRIYTSDGEEARGRLAEVAAVYRRWWENNRGRTLDELREGWEKGRRPLSDSPFVWH